MVKKALRELQKEFVELAKENEKRMDQKCAQILVAASGLKLLKEKVRPNYPGESNV